MVDQNTSGVTPQVITNEEWQTATTPKTKAKPRPPKRLPKKADITSPETVCRIASEIYQAWKTANDLANTSQDVIVAMASRKDATAMLQELRLWMAFAREASSGSGTSGGIDITIHGLDAIVPVPERGKADDA